MHDNNNTTIYDEDDPVLPLLPSLTSHPSTLPYHPNPNPNPTPIPTPPPHPTPLPQYRPDQSNPIHLFISNMCCFVLFSFIHLSKVQTHTLIYHLPFSSLFLPLSLIFFRSFQLFLAKLEFFIA